jgi:hypothetical protein
VKRSTQATAMSHRNRDAANEGGIVLADQEHCITPLVIAGLDPAIHLIRDESYED